ncbi:hypothetical protein FZD47_24010 [Bacillus infantis]|uniref:ArpU family transcriptional regulator n=1 Tax=Bacillus infantis TaxID=324767 RepID=A0A5D4S731_9BACI|nr:hypothetical protein [Bacillus infantis]TYS57904.1 hypothetical protein FZD47_24010 [Bacillus infantis]
MEVLNSLSAKEIRSIRKAVENDFERYRFYQLIECKPVPALPEGEEEMRDFCSRIEGAVSRLPAQERFLIQQRYLNVMEYDYIRDQQIYSELFDPPISAATYSKIRTRALNKLAAILGVSLKGVVNGAKEKI